MHRRCQNPESEALLLDTYQARLGYLTDRNLDWDAANLIELLRQRFPLARDRWRPWENVLSVRRGQLAPLLQPLNDPALPAAAQSAIAASLRRDVRDLHALAECPALPADHPWRTAHARFTRHSKR